MSRTSLEELNKLYEEYYYSKKPININYPNIEEDIENNIDIMLLTIKKKYRKNFVKASLYFAKYVSKNNIKSKDIAKIIGVTPTSVSKWITGKGWPLQKNIYKISIHFGFDFNQAIHYKGVQV
jgi:hypothetical protein